MSHISTSQNLHLIPEVKSPNVANFETFGNVPVNFFTGTPNISIPIYTLQSGNIQVPINLSYHPSNVKPATQPGWVGFGWSLNPGGSITRKVNNYQDEYYEGENSNAMTLSPYYPYPEDSSYNYIIPSSDLFNNNPNWNSTSYLQSLTQMGTQTIYTDPLADEFNFNFLGYSGKFFYSGSEMGWQVVSDQKLKVEILGFLQPEEIVDIVEEHSSSPGVISVPNKQSRFFKGFRITTPDGTQYEFGGNNGVELTSPYGDSHGVFSINTWVLTKIIDVNNNVVQFQYKRNYPTCSLSFYAFSSVTTFNGTSQNDNFSSPHNGWQNGVAYPNKLYGSFVWPLYLEKISSSNTDIVFSSNRADCLVYTTAQMSKPVGDQPLYLDMLDYINNDINNLQWEKLDKIEIIDRSQLNNIPSMLHKFFYEPDPNKIKRLTLNSYQRSGNSSNETMLYEFGYNDIAAYNNITGDGNYSDHWGFFNGIYIHPISGVAVSSLPSVKAINTDKMKKGLLNKIIYPTAGYTTFTWEPHDYSQVVSTNRSSLVTSLGQASGVRIKEINSYSEINELISKKTYWYKNNFAKGINLNTLSSSGVLNVLPQYTFHFQNRIINQSGGTASYSRTTFNSITDYGYNGQGSHIGYSEVTEESMDGSYTKNYFTNYGVDIHGQAHFDKPAAGYIGFLPDDDAYMPHSLLDLERGKEVGRFDYNNNNDSIRKTITYYRDYNSEDNRFDQYIKRIPWVLFFRPNDIVFTSLALIASTKEFNYVYYPIKTETTTYDTEGNNPIVTTTEYAYNDSNQISEQKTFSSTGNELKTTYIYPSDLSDSMSNERKALNYISSIIESKQFEAGIQTSRTLTDYIKTNGMFLPNSIKRQKGVSDPMITDIQVLRNDDVNGNILEYTILDGTTNVMVWGHGNQYPIAKIENASYSDVAAALGISVNELDMYNEQNINELNGLRASLSSAMITTYTYDPLYGIRSMTDPRGQTAYYYYDDFGRLSYTRDNDGKIMSYTEYHYKN